MYDQIPAELQSLAQWGLYQKIWQPEKQKYTKIPYSAKTGTQTSTTDSKQWVTFDEAKIALAAYSMDGLGFFFANGYFGVDVDHIGGEIARYRDGDITDNQAYEFMAAMHSYTEVSMSGEGIHIIGKGHIPGDRRRSGDVEMYDSGRFFAMTGNRLGPYTAVTAPNEAKFKRLYTKYLEPKKVIAIHQDRDDGGPNSMPADEIVAKMLASKTGQRIKLLLNGGWEQFYPSQSEADLALANDLAFWTGRDYSKMDEIFRQSSLMRSKYDEKHGKTTYGAGLLNKAINDTDHIYHPEREPLKYKLNFGHKKDGKPKDFPPHSWDDTGNAQRLVDRFGDVLRWSPIDKAWYAYNGSFWTIDTTGELGKMVDLTIDDLKNEKIICPPEVKPEDMQQKWAAFMKTSRQHRSKNAMVEETKHRLTVQPDEFDRDSMLFNVDNGYIDLASGELHDHAVKQMFSQQGNFEYTDKVDAPEWQRFLEQIFDGDTALIEYLQKALGYSLTGSTKEQVMFILHGKGRNGKSIFLETVSNIMGSYAKTIQAETIMVHRQSGPNSDIARLKGARLVTSSEPNEGYRLDEGLVKQLTGGDKVTARKLYGQEFEFEPQFKLWLATNHKPIIRGTDDGIWRRLMLIPFRVQIPDNKVDRDLKYKLERESIGILNWMVDGALKWQREGLTAPDGVIEASKNYRSEMDVLTAFVEDVGEVGPGFTWKANEAFKAYKNWASENAQYMMSSTKFGKEMADKYPRKHTKYGNVYQGVRPITDPRLNFANN